MVSLVFENITSLKTGVKGWNDFGLSNKGGEELVGADWAGGFFNPAERDD